MNITLFDLREELMKTIDFCAKVLIQYQETNLEVREAELKSTLSLFVLFIELYQLVECETFEFEVLLALLEFLLDIIVIFLNLLLAKYPLLDCDSKLHLPS